MAHPPGVATSTRIMRLPCQLLVALPPPAQQQSCNAQRRPLCCPTPPNLILALTLPSFRRLTMMSTAQLVETPATCSAAMVARVRFTLSALTWCRMRTFPTSGFATSASCESFPRVCPSTKARSQALSTIWRRAYPAPLAYPSVCKIGSRASRLVLTVTTRR
jgi:hypothetical protein